MSVPSVDPMLTLSYSQVQLKLARPLICHMNDFMHSNGDSNMVLCPVLSFLLYFRYLTKKYVLVPSSSFSFFYSISSIDWASRW